MNLTVIGTGYVGLVTGTCLAETGNHVVCVDIDQKKVKGMQDGQVPIYEPGLEVLFHRNIHQGRLTFMTDLQAGIKDAEVIFLALPTPPGGDGSADLSYILGVAERLKDLISHYVVIVDKSTVPVGTADQVQQILAKKLDPEMYDVVSNPEFLREGVAVDDFMKPDRIVIGTNSDKAKKVMERLYGPFVRQGNPVLFMDVRSAEMTKYAANSYLATRISFMNEIANICEKLGANVDMVRKGMGTDTRIGKRFLFPGVGYGGSCFPKDVQAMAKTAQDNSYEFKILEAVMKVNHLQKQNFADRIINYFNGDLSDKKVAVWGIAFKPNTDDIREAPAIEILQKLLDKGAQISAYDPEAIPNAREVFGEKISFAKNPYDTLIEADALVLITEWNVFRTPEYDEMIKIMKNRVIFDGRNLYDPDYVRSLGFHYESIGRP